MKSMSLVAGSNEPSTAEPNESDPLKRRRAYLDLWKALKQLFGREVDLVEVTTIDNPYLARAIETSHVELYDAA